MHSWCDKLEERSGGRVSIERAMGAALGKEEQYHEFVTTGICDVAWYNPASCEPGLYPMSDIVGLPWAIPDAVPSCKAILAVWDAGYMDKEYADVKVLFFTTGTGDCLYTTKEPVKTLADVEGKKIFAHAESSAKRVEAMGAIPVTLPVTETASAIERGIVDGIVTLATAIGPNSTYKEFLHYGTGPGFANFQLGCFMNWGVWNSLPADIQGIIDDLFEEISIEGAAGLTQMQTDCREYFFDQGGQWFEWSDEDMATIGEGFAPIWDEFVAAREKRGLPIRDALDLFYKTMEDNGISNPGVGYTPGG
jgi:TRAP-type C4-dicarboxylate transport system substrate-binding protein